MEVISVPKSGEGFFLHYVYAHIGESGEERELTKPLGQRAPSHEGFMSVTITPQKVKLLMPQKIYWGGIQLITPIHIGLFVILKEEI